MVASSAMEPSASAASWRTLWRRKEQAQVRKEQVQVRIEVQGRQPYAKGQADVQCFEEGTVCGQQAQSCL